MLFQTLKSEYGSIQGLTTELHTLTDQLANYFCEVETQFNLQENFKCLVSFCKEVQKCQQVGIQVICITWVVT